MKRINRGFTLVELMIVVLIISLMIFILIPAVNGVVKQVKAHQTQQLVNLLDLGCQQYKAAFGSYPPNWISPTSPPSANNLDGWNWGENGDPYNALESPFLLIYCLQGPAGMGWKVNRDGKLSNNSSASVTADFGPWVEAGNQSIQPCVSNTQSGGLYRPAFYDSFGTPILYFAALRSPRPNLACPFDQYYWIPNPPTLPQPERIYDRYCADDAGCYHNQFGSFFNQEPLTYPAPEWSAGFVVNSLGIKSYSQMTGCPSNFTGCRYQLVFYAAMMNQTFNQSTGWSGSSMTGVCYHPNSFVIWSAGPDQLFGFWYWDDSWGGYVLDLTFNPANFNDITNFR